VDPKPVKVEPKVEKRVKKNVIFKVEIEERKHLYLF